MRITLRDATRRRDVTMVASHRATVADLSRAAGWDPDGGLRIDGHTLAPSTELARAGIVAGSVIHHGAHHAAHHGAHHGARHAAAGPAPRREPGGAFAAVAGGLISGPRFPVSYGELVVGRAEGCDVVLDSPTVSQRHARLDFDGGQLRVHDLGSRNGTWLGETPVTEEGVDVGPGTTVRLGAVTLRLDEEDHEDAAPLPLGGGAATTPFLRRPREAPPAGPQAVEPPAAPSGVAGTSRGLTITMMLAPLLMAGVMVGVFGRWQFALFGMMTPLIAIGNWLEGKRRARKARSGGDRTFNAAVAIFRQELIEAGDAERQRRRDLAPDPAECMRRASLPSVRLWERRTGAKDFLTLHLGVGAAPWDPPTRGPTDHTKLRAAVDDAASIPDCTVTAELGGGPLALTGDRAAALAVARSLLCQAATHHGPADLALAVVADPQRLAEWEWLKWLPHACDAATGDPRAAATGQAAELVADIAELGSPTLLVLDVAPEDPILSDVGRLLATSAVPLSALVLTPDARAAPAWCVAIVAADDPDGAATLHEPRRRRTTGPCICAGVTPETAEEWVRALARLHDPEAAADGREVPPSVTLDAIVGEIGDPEALTGWWEEREPGAIPIGLGPRGRVGLDFETAGPFGVVVGGSGSGRSTTLRTIAASAAASAPPDRLALVLWSVGDPTFGPLTELPHVAASVTGPGVRDKLLDALRVEVSRRAAGTAGPELLVLVDDAQAVTSVVDTTIDELADIAASGAAVGVRVVVASRRWGGVLSRSAAAVPGPRVVLRLASEADAVAVSGDPAPASFDRERRGRAMVVNDDTRSVVQVARASDQDRDRSPVVLEAFPLVQRRRSQVTDPAAERAALAELVRVVRDTGVGPAEPLFRDPRTSGAASTTLTLADLIGEDPSNLDAKRRWSDRAPERTLVATVGTVPGGRRLDLNLRESALGGQGPHGVVVGATGSGKSEFLRTLLADLLANHSPDELAMVLVDFKGGATFAPISSLPHVAGVITNLENDLAMIDRMQAALEGEMRRRQQRLHEAGVPSVLAYEEARQRRGDLVPLPSLLIVVDEFAELLVNRPEFLDALSTIGRVGRSLGVHLLLASQRLEEGRLRGLDSHLRYRVALRTFNAADSRAILGTKDAAQLPSVPGAGYVKLDDELVRFQSGYVSGEVSADGGTELDTLAAQLVNAGDPVHQVWLPPLGDAIPLDRVTGGTQPDPDRGLIAPHWPGVGRLLVPLGVVDRPEDQSQEAHAIDLRGAGGNLVVVGAPQTGKTTTLRTMVAGLAISHAPTEVQIYAIDHGGGGLEAFAGLPHVGTVAGRRDVELARRVIRHVAGILALREQTFTERGVDGMAEYRRRRASGQLADDPYGDVFLLIDGWNSVKAELGEAEPLITDLAARGLGYGVHVALTANRWMDMRAALRDGFGSKLELRLTDPFESNLGRKTAATLPTGVPGRGLAPDGHHLQVALPRVDSVASADDLAHGVADLVERVAGAWSGPCALPVRLLPERVTVAEMPAADDGPPHAVPIGVAETDLLPLRLDLTGSESHFLVFGDGQSGKSSFLANFARTLAARCTPEQARFMVIDYRRSLLEVVPEAHLLAYAGASPAAGHNVGRLRDTLLKRVPGDDVTAAQLRGRTWWTGPEVYLLVDDYDLVVNPSGNPLAPLTEFLAQGRDLGFHLILARRASGASRGFEPVLQRIRELGSAGLLLSGDPKEGALLGGMRPEPQPPGRGLLVRRGKGAMLVQTVAPPDPAGDTPAPPGEG